MNPYFDFTNISQLPVSPYTITMCLSFVAAAVVVFLYLRRIKIPADQVICFLFLVTLLMIFGAKLNSFLTSKDAKNLLLAGFSGVGGALGVLLGTFIFGLIRKDIKKDIFNSQAVALPLLYGISKLGCFFVGCCRGIPYSGPFYVKYAEPSHDTFYFFPQQLAESLTFIIIFFVLLKKANKSSENIMGYTVILCCLAKFALDFLREVHVNEIVSINQICCLVIAVITIIVLKIIKKRPAKSDSAV